MSIMSSLAARARVAVARARDARLSFAARARDTRARLSVEAREARVHLCDGVREARGHAALARTLVRDAIRRERRAAVLMDRWIDRGGYGVKAPTVEIVTDETLPSRVVVVFHGPEDVIPRHLLHVVARSGFIPVVVASTVMDYSSRFVSYGYLLYSFGWSGGSIMLRDKLFGMSDERRAIQSSAHHARISSVVSRLRTIHEILERQGRVRPVSRLPRDSSPDSDDSDTPADTPSDTPSAGPEATPPPSVGPPASPEVIPSSPPVTVPSPGPEDTYQSLWSWAYEKIFG